MTVYILLTILIVVLLYFSRLNENKTVKELFFSISILMLTLVAGFRWNVGTDFLMYNDLFYTFRNHIVFSNKLEPMFMLFCYIPGKFFSTSFMTFTLIAFFIYYLVGVTCKKNCKYYDISLLLFLCLGMYFSSLNIVRQWMSIAVLLKLYSILDEKFGIKHVLLVTLSFMCHYTSIFSIPIIVICKKITKEKTRIILLVVFIALKFSINNLTSIILNLISNITFFEKYFKYFSKPNYMNASFLWPVILLIIYISYLFLLRNKMTFIDKCENRKINVWLNILVFAFGFQLLGMNIDLMERMSHYFYPIIILLIPKICEHVKNKNNRKIVFAAILIFSVIMMILNLRNNGGHFLPYQTIFMEVLK